MATVTLLEVADAIRDTLQDHPQIYMGQSADELTESVNDFPLVQVYPAEGGMHATATDRQTMGGGVQGKQWIYYVECLARQRSQIAEDMGAVTAMVDVIITQIEKQTAKPYFGLDAIHTFTYSWQYTAYEYNKTPVVGIRFIITTRIY